MGPAIERRAIVLFLALLVLFAAAAYVPIVIEGSLGALDGWALPLIMWAPGAAAIITSIFVHRSLKPCGLLVPRRSLPWLLIAMAVPVAYTIVIYLPLGALGIVRLGGPHLTFDFLVVGLVWRSLPNALGEEVGWRGYLAPVMTTRFGFLRGNVLIGVLWAMFHFPAILFAGYGQSATGLFGLVAFTSTVIALSVFLGYLRSASESVWPAAFFHATHNLIFLHVFDPIERVSPLAAWLMGELGALLCIVMIALAAASSMLSRKLVPR